MRENNRSLTLVIALLIAAVLFSLALRERQSAQDALPEALPTETPAPTETPTPDSALRGKIRISELMEKNRSVAPDVDGDFPDWIEIWNASDEAVDLDGWRLADRAGRAGWVFPAQRLEAGERLLVYASRKNRAEGELHTDFALSARDCVWLYDADGAIVDTVACAGCEDDVSLALTEDGSLAPTLYPTPRFENSTAGYELYQQTLTARGPLAVYEAAVANFGSFTAGNSRDLDWVELRNISAEPVALSDYYLSDKSADRFLYRLPEKTLAPGAYIVFVCDDDPSGFYGSVPCTGFALDSSHEQLYLSDGSGALIDCVTLRDIPYGGSCGRMDGEAGFFYFAKPSPGKDNTNGMRRVGETPASLTADGVYDGVESLTVELSGRGILRYTLDGSAPGPESPLYEGPFEITETTVVRVRSYEDDALPSRCLTLSYILNEGHTLPVVSLVTDSPRQFSAVYDAGDKVSELPGAVSLYRNGESFTINCGISMNGETSLIMPKKNMALRFRGAYGQESLHFDIFGGGAADFTHLLLRAGQDQLDTVIRNELAQSLAEKAGAAVINQRSIFCALYINGRYSGLYTLKERPNATLYAAVAGVDRESVEIYEAPAPYDSDFYTEVVNFVNKHDMSDEDNYRRFCAVMNIDSLIDWLFFEGYCANTDLTSGNLRFARSEQADGRWHLLFYDLDAAFRSFASIQTNLLNDWAAARIQVAGFSVPLMKNAAFRDRFLTRAAGYLREDLSNEQVLAEIDRMTEEIRPELVRDYARFGADLGSWERSLRILRGHIGESDWRQANIDALCRIFELSAEERAQYFGDIDAKG